MKKLITKPLKIISIGALALSFNALQVASASNDTFPIASPQLQIEDMGHLAYLKDGELKTQLPVSTTVMSRISEDSVSVEVIQAFINTHEQMIEAEYYFPAPEYATVTDFEVSNDAPCGEVNYSVVLEKDEVITVTYQYEMDLNQLEIAQKHIPNVLGFQAITRLEDKLEPTEQVADLVAKN